jgi:Outer membrane protein beta-barrel domain
MRNYLAAAVVCLSVSSQAFADGDAKSFEGLNIQAGIGAQRSEYQNTDMIVNGVAGYSTNDTKSTEFSASLGLGYQKAISDKFLLGGIAEYNPKDSTSGHFDYRLNGVVTAPNDGHSKFRNQYNLAVVLGYAIDPTTLAYAKLGYAGYNLDLIHTNGDPTDSYTIHGISYGLGAKKLINEHIYGYAEFNYIDYSDKHWSSVVYGATGNRTSSTYNGLVGIGYKF